MKHTVLALSQSALAVGLIAAPVDAGVPQPSGETTATKTEARWFADYDEAATAAKAQGKDLFVDFTGSDWCGWCIRLHDEVFDHDAWGAGVGDDLVFVALDFPRSSAAKAAVPNPGRNNELKNTFRVSSFPTILLMNADGVAYAQTGYQAGGPEKYVAHVQEIMAAGKRDLAAATALLPAFTAAEDENVKWAAWDGLVEGYGAMAPASSPVWGPMERHIRWGMDADPENASGKKALAIAALLGKGIADHEIMAFVLEHDAKNEAGLFEKVTAYKFSAVRDDASAKAAVASLREVNALGFRDEEQGFQLNLQAATWCAGPLRDEAGRAEFAKKALEIGSDDKEMMAALLELAG